MSECNCSMRIRLVGDGCHICNPERWEEMLREDDDDPMDTLPVSLEGVE